MAVQTGYVFAAQQGRFDYVIQFDADGQQIDLRPTNSWTRALAEVTPLELLEVQAV